MFLIDDFHILTSDQWQMFLYNLCLYHMQIRHHNKISIYILYKGWQSQHICSVDIDIAKNVAH